MDGQLYELIKLVELNKALVRLFELEPQHTTPISLYNSLKAHAKKSAGTDSELYSAIKSNKENLLLRSRQLLDRATKPG